MSDTGKTGLELLFSHLQHLTKRMCNRACWGQIQAMKINAFLQGIGSMEISALAGKKVSCFIEIVY